MNESLLAFKIRLATISDAKSIAELNGDVQRLHANALPQLFKQPIVDGATVADFENKICAENQFIWLALDLNVAAGYVFAQVLEQPETQRQFEHRLVYVHHISVRPEYQGRGIGRALLNAVKNRAVEIGIHRMALDVWRFNEDARQFFRDYGLEVYNEKMSMEI
jgi:ribosomal protein S18 acetylase RimI-like enzyme